MEQFDKTTKNTTNPKMVVEPVNILVIGSVMSEVDAIRASLEVHGHSVSQATTLPPYKKLACQESFEIIFVATDDETVAHNEIFELAPLLHPNAIVIGYCEDPTPDSVKLFKDGCSVHPSELLPMYPREPEAVRRWKAKDSTK